MSDFVLDASVTLQWLLEDEVDRDYSLSILPRFDEDRALVPVLWCYEVGNGLLVAHRQKRISLEQIGGFVDRLRSFPIDVAQQTTSEIFSLPAFAMAHGLTNYDAAYLSLAIGFQLPLATTDVALRRAATLAGVRIVEAQ